MAKRKSAPKNIRDPHYLSLAQPPEPGKPSEIYVDVHQPDRYLIVNANSTSWGSGRPPGMQKVRGAQEIKKPNAGGFDSLFLPNKSLFKPDYGTADDAYEVFRAWAYCQVLRSFLPVRPIVIFTGPPGAGKSTIASAVAQLWYGVDASTTKFGRLPDTLKDFIGTLGQDPFVLLDNVETPMPWMADTLCIVASGDGKITTRELYTTAGVNETTPDCFVAVTSFSAQGFTRGDLLSRSLIFQLQPPDTYISKRAWSAAVDNARTGFWTEAINVAQEILRIIDQGIPTVPAAAAFDRLQDFTWMGKAICEYFGGPVAGQRFERGMAAIALSRVTTGTNDPSMEMLLPVASQDDADQRWYTATDLLRACADFQSAERNFDLTSRSLEAFSKWLNGIATKAPGMFQLNRKLVCGRKFWNVQMPKWVAKARQVLQAPIIQQTALTSTAQTGLPSAPQPPPAPVSTTKLVI